LWWTGVVPLFSLFGGLYGLRLPQSSKRRPSLEGVGDAKGSIQRMKQGGITNAP